MIGHSEPSFTDNMTIDSYKKGKVILYTAYTCLYIQTPPEARYLDPKNIPMKHILGVSGITGGFSPIRVAFKRS